MAALQQAEAQGKGRTDIFRQGFQGREGNVVVIG
jgi:hypothetical protein